MNNTIKKLLKKITVFVMFFLSLNTVKAASNFEMVFGKDIYDRCNESTQCIPLCIYGTPEGTNYWHAYNGESAHIGYYYSENFGWEFGVTGEEDAVFFSRSTILPASDIYWSNFKDYEGTKQLPWNKATPDNPDRKTVWKPYDKMKENFECPLYLAEDRGGEVELCLSNEKGTCKEQNNIGTRFQEDRPLVSSFADDVKKVIDDTYDKLYIYGADSNDLVYVDPHIEKKIDFLYTADPSFKENYDSSKSKQDNLKSYCPILAENLKDEDKYFGTLTGNVIEYRDTLNKQLQESATALGVRNKEVYTDETLSTLLTIKYSSGTKKYRNIYDEKTKQTYIEKLHSLYAQNTVKSLNNAREVCNAIPGNKIQYDESKLKDMLTTTYATTVYKNVQLDMNSQFSCNSLGELAGLVKTGYFIIEIIALVILIVFTALDYIKIVFTGEQEEMKKTNKRLGTRIIIMAVILLLPALINFTLRLFHIEGFNSENPLCVNLKEKDK